MYANHKTSSLQRNHLVVNLIQGGDTLHFQKNLEIQENVINAIATAVTHGQLGVARVKFYPPIQLDKQANNNNETDCPALYNSK